MKKLVTTLFTALGTLTLSYGQTALNLDGIDDQVVFGNQMTIDLTGVNTFTVEAWVNPSTTTGLGVIIGNYSYPFNTNDMQFLLRRDNDQYAFWIDDGDGNGYDVVSSGAGTVTTGTWQHVTGVWDGAQITIYVDGVLLGTNTALTGPGFPTLMNEVIIGRNAVGESFGGNIDNIRIWNDARTAAEISGSMNCEVDPNAQGLLAMYHFNDGIDGGANTTNTLLFDNSGNGYHGTLQNFTLTGPTSNFTTSNRTDYISIQAALGSSALADRTNPHPAGDFNGDGFDEILATTEGGSHNIYYSDGFGHFETPVAVPNPIGGGYYVADIDNDGDIDMINYGGTDFKVYVNDGSGNFTEQTPVSLDGTGAISVARIGDVNGDNLPDVVIGNAGTGATDLNEIWINNGTVGNPSFTFLEGLNSTYGAISSIAIGDIDNDGFVDLAFSIGAGFAVVHNNDNNTTFPQGQVVGGYNGYIRFIDWNQDGHLDLVSSDGYNNWGVRVFYNNTTGTFLTTAAVAVSIAGGIDYFSYAPVRYADMNGDGFMDVVTRYWGGPGAGLFLSNGCALTLQSGCAYKIGPADNGVAIGDYNGDGTPDVFCGARDRKSSVSLNFLDPVITAPLSDVTSTLGDVVCDGDPISVEATVSNSGTINWYSDAAGTNLIGTGSPFSPTAGPGTYDYYVAAENPNGCRSLLDTVVVIVNDNPTASINTATSVTALDCFGDTDGMLNVDVTLNGTATSSTYVWDDAATTTTQNLTGVGAGTYTITVTDNNGCTATASATVSEPTALTGSATTTAETNGNDGSIDLTPTGGTSPYTYAWTGPNGFTSTDQNPTGLEGGTYEVTITDNNGCTFVLQVTVDSFVGLTNNESIDFTVYPNPSNGVFTIETASAGVVEIININGKIIYSATTENGKTKVNVPGLAHGVYTLHLVSGNNSQFKKLVIR
ncbi:MAG: FG-GAP-like repeat-containing protein [Brumimicrobium sp.]|nr:FG-GAP-like repeat-containing protein [Brumimicrobium sp.]